MVVRYQGGNNAGHTVVTDQVICLKSSPIWYLTSEVWYGVLGDGMVVDLEHLSRESMK